MGSQDRSGLTVRAATPLDRTAWLNMRCALWPDGSRDEHRGEIEGYFAGTAREPQAVLLAERHGEVVGFAELSIRSYAEGCTSDSVAFLEGWYVTPNFRRQDVGAALIAAAEGWAIERGCIEFASDTEVDNEVSAFAHTGCGFTEVGVIRCFRKSLPKPPTQSSSE